MKRISRSADVRAFTLIALLIIIFVLAILAALLLPALAKAKQRAQRIACANNLKQNAIAFKVWGMDHNDQYPMSVSPTNQGTVEWVEGGNAFKHFQVMADELIHTKILVCPADGRTPAASFPLLRNENLSYFVGLDATDIRPAMLLDGDRNITNGLAPHRTVLALPPRRPAGWTEAIHNQEGNVGLADGSVQLTTTPAFRDLLIGTGDGTNRVALPE